MPSLRFLERANSQSRLKGNLLGAPLFSQMTWKLRSYALAICVAAVILLAMIDWSVLVQLSSRDWTGVAVLFALAALSEHLAVESGTARRVRSSIAFIPLLAATLVFPTGAVVLCVIAMYATTRGRTSALLVSGFNLSQLILAYSAAAKTFQLLSGGTQIEGGLQEVLQVFLPFYAAAVGYFGINILLISGFIAIRDSQNLFSVIGDATGRGGGNLLYDVLASPIAILVAYLYSTLHVGGLLAVLFPLLLVRYSYLSALQLEQTNRDLLTVFVKAIETRDPYTSGHSQRVSMLAKTIAHDMGLPGRVVSKIEIAALLHDIGKIDALYAEIISKDASLTDHEMEVIRTHAVKGADLLQSLSSLDAQVIDGVRHHHERYDGTGYPDGLRGKNIPLAARVIMICDAVDAMLSDRPYRDALSIETVREELLRFSGMQFDPDIVKKMLEGRSIERAELFVDRTGARQRPVSAASNV